MVQSRVKVGKDMELSTLKEGWEKKSSKPKLKWRIEGRNNIEKIINSNFDEKKFSVLENVVLNKYDIFHPKTKKLREVKSYFISEIKNWTLYSEPYFAIKTRSQLTKITTELYNNFIEKFYTYANETGLLKFIQEQMICSNDGILFKDGFVEKENLEFRTVISKSQWAGYHRIQIQFRKKN